MICGWFEPEDFYGPKGRSKKTDLACEWAAYIANKLLYEEMMKVSRLSSWPITRERYRQLLVKMRRQARRIRVLEALKAD